MSNDGLSDDLGILAADAWHPGDGSLVAFDTKGSQPPVPDNWRLTKDITIMNVTTSSYNVLDYTFENIQLLTK